MHHQSLGLNIQVVLASTAPMSDNRFMQSIAMALAIDCMAWNIWIA